AKNEAPKAPDNFRWRYYGLFYCAPAQSAYMCRLRIANGILTHWQFAGLADLAERYAHGYAHVTTRANIQIREIEPKNAVAMVEAIQDLGLCSRGSGADNIRNVTGTPTAGIDPQELIDTRPYAREWHFHISNDRSLYGLPRNVNVGDAVVRVFIDHGDRANRTKARLKYVLDRLDMEKFLALVEEKLGTKFVRVPAEAMQARPAFDRAAHIGVHAQKQAGFNWIGV